MLFKVINCVFFAGVSVRNIEAFQVLHTVFLKVKNSFFDGFMFGNLDGGMDRDIYIYT